MSTVTSMTRNLQIDNMTGDTCVQKVKGALKSVHGVTTQSVEVGHAAITANQSACDAACIAIGTAGYPTRELQGGDQRSDGKTSRPGVAGAGADASPDQEPRIAGSIGQATKVDSDGRSGGTSPRIPMPAPSPVVNKTAPSAPRGT